MLLLFLASAALHPGCGLQAKKSCWYPTGCGFQGWSSAMTRRIFFLFLWSVAEILRILRTESFRLWGVVGLRTVCYTRATEVRNKVNEEADAASR